MTTVEDKIVSGLCLSGSRICDVEYIGCTFNGCVFAECRLVDSAFYDCAFVNCQIISPVFDNSLVNLADFVNARLVGMRWDDACGLGKKSRPIKSLSNCVLDTCVASGMNFLRLDFSGSAIRNTVFSDCDLSGCSFAGSDLSNTSFTGCSLKNADFSKSKGFRIDIRSNALRGARFSMPEAVSLLDGLGVVVV